ncbi:DUF3565 domain-containing protein [Pseudomonas japonica]|nr:DUF3565 domain-containing protein [Pseudomonas japonica]
MQVNQRRTAGRAVDDLTSIIGKGIVDGHSLFGGNEHGVRPLHKRLEDLSVNKHGDDCECDGPRTDDCVILGFDQDAQGDWFARLSCGHTQHLRHAPPWQSRPWVVDPDERKRRIGKPFACGWCARGSFGGNLG